jgi:hypothetical protein
MAHPTRTTDPAHKVRPYLEEADIGSGEKTPAEKETEAMIREIPPLPHPAQRDRGAASQQDNPGQQAPVASNGKR